MEYFSAVYRVRGYYHISAPYVSEAKLLEANRFRAHARIATVKAPTESALVPLLSAVIRSCQ